MQMLNRLNKNNNKIKKSHAMLIGSFLVFIGFVSIFGNYFLRIKDEVYSDMRIAMMNIPGEISIPNETKDTSDEIYEVPISENVTKEEDTTTFVVDYSKYLGVLEIPKISLKRGFYNVDSKYNNIRYNVTMVPGSDLPDVSNGNLILMAHSGNAYYSYFAYLFRLSIGDMIYVTYNGLQYVYQIANIYEVPKNGVVTIHRNNARTTLTMITCTHGNDFSQTVYISELVG